MGIIFVERGKKVIKKFENGLVFSVQVFCYLIVVVISKIYPFELCRILQLFGGCFLLLKNVNS